MEKKPNKIAALPLLPLAKDVDWEESLKSAIKAELRLRGMTYADLVERLGQMGIPMTVQNLKNKISRGSFSGVFVAQCMVAMGCANLRLGGPYIFVDVDNYQSPSEARLDAIARSSEYAYQRRPKRAR